MGESASVLERKGSLAWLSVSACFFLLVEGLRVLILVLFLLGIYGFFVCVAVGFCASRLVVGCFPLEHLTARGMWVPSAPGWFEDVSRVVVSR